MAQVSLPYTLQAGQPENVNQLVANLNALVAGVNTVDTAQLASGSVSQAKLAAGVYVPIGGIVQFGGSTAPSNWLICNGDAVSRTTYADLFTALGTSYGSGDGSTTFNVPNLKGRVPVGLDSTQTEFDLRGETGGTKTHSLSEAEMPAHSHGPSGNGADQWIWSSGVNYGLFLSTSGTYGVGYSYDSTTKGSGAAHNNLQPYVVVNFIIRAL